MHAEGHAEISGGSRLSPAAYAGVRAHAAMCDQAALEVALEPLQSNADEVEARVAWYATCGALYNWVRAPLTGSHGHAGRAAIPCQV